jgi:hypothetical protein
MKMMLVKKVCVMFALSCGVFVVGSEKSTDQKDFTADETLLMELSKKYCKNSSCETIGTDSQHGRRLYIPMLKSPDQKKRWFGRGSSGKGEGRAKL